jgi:hypothetical protein
MQKILAAFSGFAGFFPPFLDSTFAESRVSL